MGSALVATACFDDNGGDLPGWCRPDVTICLSDAAVLPYETIEVIARDEAWAGETVRACAYPVAAGSFRDPLAEPSGADDPCEIAAAAGATITDFEVQAGGDGEVRFQLEPLSSDEHPLGTRDPGVYRLVVENRGSRPSPISQTAVLFGVVDLEER